jgi:hypothetical protein
VRGLEGQGVSESRGTCSICRSNARAGPRTLVAVLHLRLLGQSVLRVRRLRRRVLRAVVRDMGEAPGEAGMVRQAHRQQKLGWLVKPRRKRRLS